MYAVRLHCINFTCFDLGFVYAPPSQIRQDVPVCDVMFELRNEIQMDFLITASQPVKFYLILLQTSALSNERSFNIFMIFERKKTNLG